MKLRRQAYLSSAAICATLLTSMAHGAAAQTAVADDESMALEEVVVTARKREETLQDVPVSVAAVSGEALRDEKILNQVDLAMRIPAFKQTTAGVNTYTFIRGVGSGGNPSFEQSVASFVDGVYAGRGQQSRFPYYDLARVEVLRGPQVALYGNSAIAGAISVITRKPGVTFEGDLSVSYETQHQETILQGGVTLPVNDKFRIRVAGYVADLDKGWLKTIRPTGVTHDPRRRDRAGRIIAEFEPTEDLSVELKYDSYSLLGLGGTNQATANIGNGAVTEFRFDRVRSFGSGPPQNGKTEDTARMNNQTAQATVNYEVGLGTITSVTAYTWYGFSQDTEGDMSPLPIFDYDHHEHYNQFSQELRLTSAGDQRLNYIVGVYYQQDDLTPSAQNKLNLSAQPAPFGSPLPPIARLSYLDQQTKNYSVFFDTNYQLTDGLKINVAARYMRVEKEAEQGSYSVRINTTTPDPSIEQSPAPGVPSIYSRVYGFPHIFRDLELSESHFMPEVGLQYKIENGMFYAKVVRGAKAGGFDWVYAGADRNALKFLPEKATSYEAGYRGTLLDGRLYFGATIYRTEIEDLQVSVFDGRTSYVVGNAAKQRAQGVETDFTWRPTAALRINGALAYSDAYWVSYPNSACYVEQRLATPAGTVCRQDLTGKPAPVNSKWSASFGVSHTAELGPYVLTTQANYSYRTKSNLGLSNDPMQIQKAFGLLDARLALATADERWTVAVFGKNLTDELYSDYGTDAPSVTGVRFRDTQRTRQVGVELSTRF